MRCSAPFCKNNSDDVSTEGKGISFHAFPSEKGLRAAWLRALGKQGSLLPDSAVVCSQHFLDDDICATESGLRQLASGAVPSTVQVCMICLDTDSRLFLMSKYKMEEAYEKLTGYPPCDVGNLKQALCIQCAQRLKTFSQFKDKSLRARAIMMDLVEKHELITRRHIKMINRTKNQLDNSFVVTTLGPDPCDLHIQEHPSEEQRTDSEATLQTVVKVEKEDSCDSISFNEDNAVEDYDSNAECVKNEFIASNEDCLKETKDPLKYESALFQCTLCCEEFESEPAYEGHMGLHAQAGVDDWTPAAASSSCPAPAPRTPHRSAVRERRGPQSADPEQPAVSPFLTKNNGNKLQAEEADTVQRSRQVFIINDGELDDLSFDTKTHTKNDNREEIKLIKCVVKLYDVFKKPNQCVPIQDESLVTQRVVGPWATKRYIDTASRDLNCQVASQNEDNEPTINKKKIYNQNFVEQKPNCSNISRVSLSSETKFSCELCKYKCTQRSYLMRHMKIHSEEKPYSCDLCKYKCAQKRSLVSHMVTHTSVKPFSCELCKCKFGQKANLVRHMKTHSGEKPYCCQLCEYKAARNSHLVRHMKTHTGEKPYSCQLCKYKCKASTYLVSHMKTHTGEMLYSCDLCEYKCIQKNSLVIHMRYHSGEKPYSCELCKYKCAQKSFLVRHMVTHTVVKPFSCELCKCKFGQKAHLVNHMKTHSGEKPYCCQLCEYKAARNSHLVLHMKTHTGEMAYSCDLCKYKCAQKRFLVSHMITHTGVKPFSCELCKCKFGQKADLVRHMKTHSGEKPYCCQLCEYKAARNNNLVQHMRTHTDEKPYSCKLCKYKCKASTYLVSHMKTHTGEMLYSCDLCEYKCIQKNSLVIHMRNHSGEKPYSCRLCKYKCAGSSYLARHMRTHSGEKPYSCKLCKYKFRQKMSLVHHMRSHTGEKPYSCELCKYKCARSSYLVGHMRTHTGEKSHHCQLCKYKAARNSHLVSHMRTHTGKKP